MQIVTVRNNNKKVSIRSIQSFFSYNFDLWLVESVDIEPIEVEIYPISYGYIW
jgi:hypothetical protein